MRRSFTDDEFIEAGDVTEIGQAYVWNSVNR